MKADFSVPRGPASLDADGDTKRHNFKAAASGEGEWRHLAVPLHFGPDAAVEPGSMALRLSVCLFAGQRRVCMTLKAVNLNLCPPQPEAKNKTSLSSSFAEEESKSLLARLFITVLCLPVAARLRQASDGHTATALPSPASLLPGHEGILRPKENFKLYYSK